MDADFYRTMCRKNLLFLFSAIKIGATYPWGKAFCSPPLPLTPSPFPLLGECEQENIFEILIRAAAQKDSIENTSKVLKNVPRSKNIYYHLGKYSDLNSLESDLNAALQSRLPEGIKKGRHKIAIDFNLIPYYGEPSPSELPYIYRSQAKSGTCSFYEARNFIRN